MLAVYIIYGLILLYGIYRILIDTHSTPKTLGYILLVILFPVVGLLIYVSFGINYRHLAARSAGMQAQNELDREYLPNRTNRTEELMKVHAEELSQYWEMIGFLERIGNECLSEGEYRLLVNGEEKFPELLAALDSARHYIHMEYYAWENDIRGNQVKDMLLKKVREGVKVRVLYDDYASRKIRKNIVRELREAGVELFPKVRVRLIFLANRVNHRDHRKIVIVDGTVGFVGGINLSDRYDNTIQTGLFWRDTHLKISGPPVLSLQRHFIVSWNACKPHDLGWSPGLFPEGPGPAIGGCAGMGQVVAGGPYYPMSNIMLTYLRLFTLARRKLYITNPYFIPSDTILDALKQAAISGVDVRLLLPGQSDSVLVSAASRFYFKELLEAGVRIFLYEKGFVHAKTLVADGYLSVVGTANMDIRSFDLNFEIMPVIYSTAFGGQMEKMFMDDLGYSTELKLEEWLAMSRMTQLKYAAARLISAFL